MLVREVMTSPAVTVSPEESLGGALDLLDRLRITALPAPAADREVGDGSRNTGRVPARLPCGDSEQDGYSHSMVPGGFEVMSRVTRLTSATSLVIRVEIFSRRS
jgi:CBS domain-containing protein